MIEAVWVYMTASSRDNSLTIARTLVEESLVACANIIPGMRSVYRWQGEVCEDDEYVVIVKTTAARVPALKDRVTELHEADCPCILVLPVVQGHQPFLDWIGAQVSVDAEIID